MSEKMKSIVALIAESKPVDAAKLFDEMIAERLSDIMPDVMSVLGESVISEGPEDEDDNEEIAEIDFDEMSDEEFADILSAMSDEDFDDLIGDLGELDEEELAEISKARVGQYAVAALGNREKARNAVNAAGSAAYKASGHLERAKKNGPDRDYGETDANHAGRVATLQKRKDKAIADRNKANHTYEKRGRGIANASKRLAKEDVELTDAEFEEILESLSIAEYEQLDEISKGRLQAYMSKNSAENRPSPYGIRYMKNGKAKDDAKRKAHNRGEGFGRAFSKARGDKHAAKVPAKD